MVDPEEWLRANAVRCRRYRALISPSACRQHQVVEPEACAKCEKLTEEDPGRGVRFRAVSARRARAQAIREEESMSEGKTITCRDCGNEGRNGGRGLCTRCYNRHRRAGTLSRFEPLVVEHGPGRPPEAAARAEPPEQDRDHGSHAHPAQVSELEAPEEPSLVLVFATERDRAVLHALHRQAMDERRLPEAQAIHLLEQVLRHLEDGHAG
ncbi:MAG TPA: hypothetical protein ENK62_03375 [Chromatiales bacterium]|nr:hypothetical protein [Chromatiales bacterium]